MSEPPAQEFRAFRPYTYKMVTIGGVHPCEKPGCEEESEKTYHGEHGNKLSLCGKHYYKLVTDDTSEVSPLGLGTDDVPRWGDATLNAYESTSGLIVEPGQHWLKDTVKTE